MGLLAGGGLLGYWAASTAAVPPVLPEDTAIEAAYTIQTGTIGRTVRIPVTASWVAKRTLYAGLDGTLTSAAHRPGDEVSQGAVIATVDLEPLVVASGSVPMFRTLKRGSSGPDVAQLQTLLRTQRFYRAKIDGQFGALTERAVTRWQKSIGAMPNGIVDAGSIIFIASLPARIAVLPTLGQHITVGAELVRVFEPVPVFLATIAMSPRSELVPGTAVEIEAPQGGTWRGVMETFEPLDDGRFTAHIRGGLCGRDCGSLSLDSKTSLTGTVELVPPTDGPIVPTSALVQQPSGSLAVTLSDGTIRSVRVLADADGFAVIEGVAAGTRIKLPAPPTP